MPCWRLPCAKCNRTISDHGYTGHGETDYFAMKDAMADEHKTCILFAAFRERATTQRTAWHAMPVPATAESSFTAIQSAVTDRVQLTRRVYVFTGNLHVEWQRVWNDVRSGPKEKARAQTNGPYRCATDTMFSPFVHTHRKVVYLPLWVALRSRRLRFAGR